MTAGAGRGGAGGGSAARQATRSLVLRTLLVLLGGVTGIVIARTLHPQGRGAYAILVALAGAAMALGHLSVDQAHVALWAGRRDAITTNSALLGPVLGTLAAAGALVLVLTGVAGPVPAANPALLIAALLAVPLSMSVLYLSNALVLDARVGAVDRASLLGSVVQCGALLLVTGLGWLTVGWVVWIWAATIAVALVPLLRAARPRLRYRDPGLARRALSLGARYHAGSACLYLTWRVDVLILGALASRTAVGLYALAVTVAELVRLPTDALARASLAGQAGAELTDAVRVTARATRASVLLSAGCVAVLCALAPVLVPAAYGADFAGSVPALLVLAPGVFALGAGRQLGAYLVRLGRPLLVSVPSAVALAVNIAANLVLIPRWGVAGCAFASSLSYTLLTVVQAAQFCRATATPARDLLPGRAEFASLRQAVARLIQAVRPARVLRARRESRRSALPGVRTPSGTA